MRFFIWSSMGRPSTYTPKKADAVLADLERGEGVARAAKAVGVSRKTIYNWRDAKPAFGEQFDDVQEGITDDIERTLIQKALAGDVTAAIFLLKSRRRTMYGERHALEMSGKDGAPLVVTFGTDPQGPQ